MTTSPPLQEAEIPADVLEAATEIVDRIAKVHVWKGDCVADVARAILAERQRCADVAVAEYDKRFENIGGYPFSRVHDFLVVARAIERGIRKGGE